MSMPEWSRWAEGCLRRYHFALVDTRIQDPNKKGSLCQICGMKVGFRACVGCQAEAACGKSEHVQSEA